MNKQEYSMYEDIINLPHHVSKKRPQMPMSERAAQFSPFSALNGYEAAIKETARRTDKKTELTDDEKSLLDMKQRFLNEIISERPEISVTYFLPDTNKSGGAYVTLNGNLKRFDEIERILIFTDGRKIPIDDISDIDSELFRGIF